MSDSPIDLASFHCDEPNLTKPCCRRVGSWWCLLDDGHEGECVTPREREIKGSTFERGKR